MESGWLCEVEKGGAEVGSTQSGGMRKLSQFAASSPHLHLFQSELNSEVYDARTGELFAFFGANLVE